MRVTILGFLLLGVAYFTFAPPAYGDVITLSSNPDCAVTHRRSKEINYDRTVTFEVFTSHSDAVGSRKVFEKGWTGKASR